MVLFQKEYTGTCSIHLCIHLWNQAYHAGSLGCFETLLQSSRNANRKLQAGYKRMKFILGEIPFSGFQPDLLVTPYWMPTRSAYN
jgi:hypothetical protein